MTSPRDPYDPSGSSALPPPGPGTGQPYAAGPYSGDGGQGGYGQGGYGQGGYGQGGYGQPAQRRTNGFAVAALVLGILGLLSSIVVVGGLLGIIAIGLGVMGLTRARRGAGGRGLSIAGIVLGALAAVVATVILIAGISLWNSDEGQRLRECIDQAQDQAAADRCANEISTS